MKANKLKIKIIEKGFNVARLADKLGMNQATLYRKIGNDEAFTIGEARKVKLVLGLTDQEAIEIFL